ncbi:Pentalenene synthase [Termitomyces sp. T112]|nr:Pentalenene synthase [Termitomyces sp. T112]
MSTGISESVITLPDILAEWPWKRNLNPLSHLQTEAESTAWTRSFVVFTPRLQQALELGDHHLLSSLAYPLENKDVFRVGCDLMNLFFFLDECTDIASSQEVKQMSTIVLDALCNPDKARPESECFIGEATRQFWELSSRCASKGARRRFIEGLYKFTTAVVDQAHDRDKNYIKNVDEYFLVRRNTIGAMPAFAVLEFSLNLPDEVFEDPVIQKLTNICVDLIILSNDIYSYNVEQARGDANHNLVTILMHHKNLSLAETMKWIGDYASKIVSEFLDDLNHVPSFGEGVECDLERYLYGIANWVRANDCWSFECRRYFETNGLQIQQTRKVDLLPRRK